MTAALKLDFVDRPATDPVEPGAASELLQAVEELRRLPRGERKQRAEELLRALMGTVSDAMGPEPEQPDALPEAEQAPAGSPTDELVVPFTRDIAPTVEGADETLDVALDALDAKIEKHLASVPDEAPQVAAEAVPDAIPSATADHATPAYVEPEPASAESTVDAPAAEPAQDQIDPRVSTEAAAPEVTDTEIETSLVAAAGEIAQAAPEPVLIAVPSQASSTDADATLTISEPEATPAEPLVAQTGADPAAAQPAPIELVARDPEAPLDFSALDGMRPQDSIAMPIELASDEPSPTPPIEIAEHRDADGKTLEAEDEASAHPPEESPVDQSALDDILRTPESTVIEPDAAEAIFSDSELLPLPAPIATAAAVGGQEAGPSVRELRAAILPRAEPMPIPQFLSTKCESPAQKRLSSMVVVHALAAAILLVVVGTLVYAWNPLDIAGAARAALISSGKTESPVDAGDPALALTEPDRAVIAEASNHSGGAMLLDDPPIEVRPAVLTLPALPAEPVNAPAPEGVQSTESAPAVPAAPAAPVAAAPSPPSPSPAAPASLAMLPVPAGDFEALVKRGDDLLKIGDVMAARSAYERPAFGGDAAAAIGMGQTYDPLFLAQLGARGMRGDPVQAAYWYARARDAGNRDGDRKLRALFSGIQKCVIAQGACPGTGRKG